MFRGIGSVGFFEWSSFLFGRMKVRSESNSEKFFFSSAILILFEKIGQRCMMIFLLSSVLIFLVRMRSSVKRSWSLIHSEYFHENDGSKCRRCQVNLNREFYSKQTWLMQDEKIHVVSKELMIWCVNSHSAALNLVRGDKFFLVLLRFSSLLFVKKFLAWNLRYPLEISMGTGVTDRADSEYALCFLRKLFLKDASTVIYCSCSLCS